MKKGYLLICTVLCALTLAGCTKLEVLELSPTSAQLLESEKMELTLTYAPTELESEKLDLEYTSSNESVATVNQAGVITAMGIGESIISVSGKNDKEASCNISVVEIPTSIDTYVNDIIEAPHEFNLLNSQEANIAWESTDENVATINENGDITAINVGTAIISAYTNTANEIMCEIIVSEKPVIESITIIGSSELVEESKETYTLEVLPEIYREEVMTWTSSNTSVAQVVNGEVTALSVGNTVITVRGSDSQVMGTIDLSVTPLPLQISTSFSGSKSIAGSTYNMQIALAVGASGGTGTGYEYKIEIVENGSTTKSTGWGTGNSISTSLSGSGTCEAQISVKDSSGEVVTETMNLLK